MGPHRPDDGEADEVFDRKLTHVLQTRGNALEEQSRALMATGAVSIDSPEAILHAKLRHPPWRRRVLLEIAAEDPVTGEVRSNSSVSLRTAGRNRASLIEEITICLANELAHGN